MPNIGPLELAIVLVVALLIFGPKKLPGLGRQLGSGMREFKDSIGSITGKDDDDEADKGKAKASATAPPALGPAADAPAPPSAPVDDPEVVTGEARPQDQPSRHAD